MTFRSGLLASATLLGLVGFSSSQVYATGLFGAGDTVQAFYYNGVFNNPEGEITVGGSSSDPASLVSQVNYQLGSADGSTITIDNLQILITNQLSGFPFCFADTPGTACTDVVDGFDFLFTGENILGVSVDSSSASDFQPVAATFQTNTHLGLQLISPDEVRVDVTGDAPVQGHQLILDLSFASPSSVPEPSTLLLVGGALGLCLLVRGVFQRRRMTDYLPQA
jgi:hypothetical protein